MVAGVNMPINISTAPNIPVYMYDKYDIHVYDSVC